MGIGNQIRRKISSEKKNMKRLKKNINPRIYIKKMVLKNFFVRKRLL